MEQAQHDVSNPVINTLEFEGTKESFMSAISNMKSENALMQSSEIGWISIVLQNCALHFEEFCIGVFKGLIVYKNELPLIYLNNTRVSNARYVRISFNTVRDNLCSIKAKNEHNLSVNSVLTIVGSIGVLVLVYKYSENIGSVFDWKR